MYKRQGILADSKDILDILEDNNISVVADDLAQETRQFRTCLLYTSDAADDSLRVDLGGPRVIKKKTKQEHIAGRRILKNTEDDI
ncbi:R-phenyllactate dehydratase beta subunit [Clostridioides difficile]|nr:R-phenyllactate dehydratase beta subunit [Clostridioides difficile]